MHLNRRFLIIVGCSLLWGTIVTMVFYRMAAGRRNPVTQKVLIVAAVPLTLGTPITAEAVKTIQVPEALFPKGGYSRADDVIGRPVISTIQMDEPVVESRLAARGSGFGVAPMIPTGMRAASIRVNDVAGVAGFILPGMRVDVLVTGRPPGLEDTYTATVLQNVTVLSAGQATEADGKQSMSVPVVTLLVDPVQAESLTLAASEGKIQLVLRNSSDQQVGETRARPLRDLYARAFPAAAPVVELNPRPRTAAARTPPPPSSAPVPKPASAAPRAAEVD